jgi:ribosomal protein RSM22 (predicted rRNA methylase)
VHELPPALRAALAAAVARHPSPEVTAATARLVERYQEGSPAETPLLVSELDAVAYANYRMPATWAAVRAALGEAARLAPALAPRTQLDVGAGTGSAVWAAAQVWPSLEAHTVLEQVPAVLRLGAELAAGAPGSVLGTTWTSAEVTSGAALPTAELVTASYLLGELAPGDRAALVDRLVAAASEVLVVVEPGSVAGHERVLAARAQLLAAGLHVLAPCPHELACPMVGTRDWCHFSVRLERSVEHRRAKGATLGFEDEKYAYLVAVRSLVDPAAGRVVRHPRTRKGVVELELCTREPGQRTELVSKRQGSVYKAARDVEWGDAWPPTA